MNRNSLSFEEGVFAGALALPPGDRIEFIRRACGNDGALSAKLGALLRGHEQIDGALDLVPADELVGVTHALHAQAPAERLVRQSGSWRIQSLAISTPSMAHWRAIAASIDSPPARPRARVSPSVPIAITPTSRLDPRTIR